MQGRLLLLALGFVGWGCSSDQSGAACATEPGVSIDHAYLGTLAVDGGGAPDGSIPSCTAVSMAEKKKMQGAACNDLCKDKIPKDFHGSVTCEIDPVCGEPGNYSRFFICDSTCP